MSMSEIRSALRLWLQKLKAAEPALREQSIKALEMLGDTDALPALAEVFATDPEPDLRALAQQAGKTIYYGAIRQKLEEPGASEADRVKAAEILALARAKKTQEIGKK
jgi:hypothetical protein